MYEKSLYQEAITYENKEILNIGFHHLFILMWMAPKLSSMDLVIFCCKVDETSVGIFKILWFIENLVGDALARMKTSLGILLLKYVMAFFLSALGIHLSWNV